MNVIHLKSLLPSLRTCDLFLQAEKKGASNTFIGLIFGCFALVNFLTSLIWGNYVSIIEAVTYFCDDTSWYMKTIL